MHFTVPERRCQSATPLRRAGSDQASASIDPPADRWSWEPPDARYPEIVIAGVLAPAGPYSSHRSVHDGDCDKSQKPRRREPVDIGMTRRCPVGLRSCRNGAL